MAYSIDPIQDNCYPGTTVLVNKLHIHDEAALQEAEALATYVNASKLEQCPLEGVFDFAHYKAIHQFLFSDLYDWAGQIRTVNLSKKGTDFCPAEEIEPQAKLIFDRLKEQNYFKGLPMTHSRRRSLTFTAPPTTCIPSARATDAPSGHFWHSLSAVPDMTSTGQIWTAIC